MFKDFANVWTIVGLARDFKRDTPLAMRVAGERVVFFRDAGGKACALIDRCPHRGVALSLGRVETGVIECPFHGWRFDGVGRNCHVPWNPDAKRENLSAVALPCRESGGLLWLYTGDDPNEEPSLSQTLTAPEGLALCAQTVVWKAHWTRVMENMLDSPHLPFVHRSTIGRDLSKHVGAGRLEMAFEPEPYGGRICASVDGSPRAGNMDYRFPNVMELFIDPPGKIFRLMVACIPEDEQTTRLWLLTVRSFARTPLFDFGFRWMNRRIAREDQAIVESSLPPVVPPAAEEASVRTDAPTLAFRKIYRERLLGSSVSAPRRPQAAAP
ncbi:MAG: Rieske iron-sulfur domain-containing protein [Methylocystaceae bacterium]|nr:MAG: Rieske iron-sulfur domain-containing protein [Methylocystaceae bacterium]